MNILVVCSGNICRSPMAAAYLRERLDGRGRHRVSSAGTLGIVDDPAAGAAVAVLKRDCAIDLRDHRSRGLSREEVEDADVILVLEAAHKRYLKALYPSHVAKVRLLSEFAPRGSGVARGSDIFDPVGMEPEAFARCFRMMRVCLDSFLQEILPR